jgi:hypothetical protein
MNKRQILASLNNIANQLDNTGLIKEANSVTNIMTRLADEFNIESPADERENKRQRIINNSLDTRVLRSNVPSTFLYMLEGNSPFVTIREIVNALTNMLQEQANDTVEEIKKGKQSADQPFENNVLRMANYFKQTLNSLLEIYNIPESPVFYYINQKANEIVERTKPQIEDYKEYHNPDLFLDDEK